MGLLNGLMVGIGEAGKTYGENRTLDIREAARKQAELDKEERIREASREDAALERTNKLEDYQMVRKDAITDEASKYALDHSQERIDNARKEKLALMQDETDFNNKNWETKLSQATQLDKATDHTDYAGRAMELKINQAKLDAAYEEAKGMSVADRRVAEGLHKMTDSYQKIITSTESSDIAKADAAKDLAGTQSALKGLYKKNGVNFGDAIDPFRTKINDYENSATKINPVTTWIQGELDAGKSEKDVLPIAIQKMAKEKNADISGINLSNASINDLRTLYNSLEDQKEGPNPEVLAKKESPNTEKARGLIPKGVDAISRALTPETPEQQIKNRESRGAAISGVVDAISGKLTTSQQAWYDKLPDHGKNSKDTFDDLPRRDKIAVLRNK